MARESKYLERRDAIIASIERHTTLNRGRPPTLRDVAKDIGCGLGTLHSYLQRMHDEDLIIYFPRTHRTLRVHPEARSHS